MNRLLLQLIVITLLAASDVYAQPVRSTASEPSFETCSVAGVQAKDVRCTDVIAYRALTALEKLRNDVNIYRSLSEFESNRKLARVALKTFQDNLEIVRAEFEPLVLQLPRGNTRTALLNALYSFRDGVFWWEKARPTGTVHVSALRFESADLTPSDAVLTANAAYTAAIHWRLADRYLKRAATQLGQTR